LDHLSPTIGTTDPAQKIVLIRQLQYNLGYSSDMCQSYCHNQYGNTCYSFK